MPEFDRRHVLVPVLLGVAFVTTAFLVTEVRRAQVVDTAAHIHDSQERMRLLVNVQLVTADAETAQRGYLLTGDQSYLEPYRQAKASLPAGLEQLRDAYANAAADLSKQSGRLIELVSAKFAEMDATLAINGATSKGALTLVKTNFGQELMQSLRQLATEMRRSEREAVIAQTEAWRRNHVINRNIAAGGAVLNIILILLAGHLVSMEIRRRASVAKELEAQIVARTRELSTLSSHLQQVSEVEKSALARELHDELGGLLVAIKMDLAQLQRHLELGKPELRERWQRIQAALSSGVDLKRRVVEQLRPTLLDNMGLVAALRWQCGETCSQANLTLNEHFPEEEPPITNDAAIAIFRVAQEALTNVVKHAKATAVRVRLLYDAEHLELQIEDDGVGLPPERMAVAGSHGLTSMRHRLRSFGGELKIETAQGGRGTRLHVWLPMPRISTFAQHAP